MGPLFLGFLAVASASPAIRGQGIDPAIARQWLDVDRADGSRPRLFRASVERVKLTYNFDARAFVRAVAAYTDTERDPLLYLSPVPRREGGLSVSALSRTSSTGRPCSSWDTGTTGSATSGRRSSGRAGSLPEDLLRDRALSGPSPSPGGRGPG